MPNSKFQYKYLVVGAGFFGSTIAERIAEELNERVLVIDRRGHIGGNCYSEIDRQSGVEVHSYGSHIFHTAHKETWNYINRFTAFNSYRHKVLAKHKNLIYIMPINLATINSFYGKNFTPDEAKTFLAQEIQQEDIQSVHNLEEKAISQIGRPLYNAFIRGYTKKQWDTDLKVLPAAIINRLPVRTHYNFDYFGDTYQGIPLHGYTEIFKKMLSHKNIEVRLNTDYFHIKDQIPKKPLVIYTGPIDQFFDYEEGLLSWRTLTFEKEVHPMPDFQGTTVVNYVDENIPFMRIHEFKHFHPERKQTDKTVTFTEFSKEARKGEEPYYPINTEKDKKILALYIEKSKKLKNIIFGGRLGEYKYFDMDKSIESALSIFENRIKP